MVDIVGLRMLFSPTYAPNLRAIDIVGSIDETIVFNFGARFYDDEIYFLNKSWLYMFKNMKDRAEIKAYLSYDLFPLSILLVALIIAVSPWLCSHLLPHFLPYDNQRIIELIFLIIIAGGLSLYAPYRTHALQIWTTWPKHIQVSLLILLGLGLLSASLAAKPSWSLLEVSLYTLLFLFALSIAGLRQQPYIDLKLTATIYLSSLAYLIILFYTNIQHHVILVLVNFINPRFFGQYQILTLWLISLPLLLTRSHRSIKYMGYLISALWWSLAYVEAAKGVFIALAITIFILFILYKRNMLNWLIPHLFVAIGGFVIYVLLQHLSPLVKHDTSLAMYQIQPTAGSISFRLELWHTALKMIRQHPWLGVGPMHFSHTLPNTNAAHPHNSLLLLASEWGLPALGLMLWVAYYGINKWIQYSRQQLNPLTLSLSATLCSGLLYSLISGVFVTPLSQLLLAFIIGWMMGKAHIVQHRSLSETAHEALIACSLAASIGIIVIAGPMLPILTQQEIQWVITQHTAHSDSDTYFAPRFWIQGWIPM